MIDFINELHDAMAQGKDKDVLGKILGNLIQYTAEHFKREEAAMDRIKYAHSIAHKAEHKKLVYDVLELQKKFDEGKALLTMEVAKFLRDWLVNHIMKTDMTLSAALKENALTGS